MPGSPLAKPSRLRFIIKRGQSMEFCSCHENVTQIAENGGKSGANNSEGRRKQFAGICPNLLISFD